MQNLKYKEVLLGLIILFSVKCGSNKNNDIKEISFITQENQNRELEKLSILDTLSIHIDNILINGKTTWELDFNTLEKQFHIDSIVPIPNYMDILASDSLIYINNTYLEFYKGKNMCLFNTIVFDNTIHYISYNGYKINQETSFEFFKTVICKKCTSLNLFKLFDYDNKHKAYSLSIEYRDNNILDDELIFIFNKNMKLIKIELWHPS